MNIIEIFATAIIGGLITEFVHLHYKELEYSIKETISKSLMLKTMTLTFGFELILGIFICFYGAGMSKTSIYFLCSFLMLLPIFILILFLTLIGTKLYTIVKTKYLCTK